MKDTCILQCRLFIRQCRAKGKEEYLYDDKALERYRKTHKGSFILQRYKGLGEMDAGAALGNHTGSCYPYFETGGDRGCEEWLLM